MHHSHAASSDAQAFWAPGTVILGEYEPLNWSFWRKTVHFTLVNFYVFLAFVQLDIGGAAWKAYRQELGFTPNFLNASVAYNYVGLACGCIFFVPFIYKYGRRPVYLSSVVLQLASCLLSALTRNEGDFIAANLVTGLGGAISETIAQVTIADIYFVHQHASMNGWFLFSQTAGATLGPVASGYVVDGQGWRWMWWWCVILFAINLVLVIFFFEESKYTIPAYYQTTTTPLEEKNKHGLEHVEDSKDGGLESINNGGNRSRRKTHLQRLALVTTSRGSIWRDFYRPLIPLFKFAAVSYAAVTFGTLSISFAVISSIMAIYLFETPYNFSASSVGLINLALFVTAILSLLFGGYGNDRLILWLSKRNRGIFEPEMRLWLALPMAIIIGSAMVGVVFVRNAASIGILFGLTPWIEKSGIRNVNIVMFCFCFLILLLPAVLLIWGKKARLASAVSYKRLAEKQSSHTS
ncbi:putative MFS-type transporter [Beauveria bassiana]|uniref:Putative MFS-type transporter n=1 Tax=Beauveria bassiana TaxID=176275 RepID=A0A2N6NSB6_BEABA|nr:putative MFS-type transporter [Beauveria bassiana]